MAQTLRIKFSYKTHSRRLPVLRSGFLAPLSLQSLMQELHQYLMLAKNDLLQPRQQALDRIMLEI